MTKKHSLRRAAALLSVILVVACGSSDPNAVAKQIADLQAKNFPMTEQQKSQFAELMAKGQALLKQGKAQESLQPLEQALAIMKQAEDAAMFNKSE